MRFNSTFGIRPPPPEDESSRTGLARRSFEGQGKRTDEDIKRKHRMEVARGYTVHRGTIEERILRDAPLRMRLARAVVNCAHHFTPAAILMSQLHRLAYKTAIENGEITYENVGGRNTVSAPNNDEERAAVSQGPELRMKVNEFIFCTAWRFSHFAVELREHENPYSHYVAGFK